MTVPTAARPRRGPRPLLLHLLLTLQRSIDLVADSTNSNGASPQSSSAKPPSLPPQFRSDHHDPSAEPPAPDRLAQALAQCWELNAALVAGIAAYRRHPFVRDIGDPPVLWQEGGSRLLDYGGAKTPRRRQRRGAVLFVPSLINRAAILDLAAERSMVRFMAASGRRTLLLDWGWPAALERGFSLTDYVAGRLERAVAAAIAATGGKVVLAGFCMGGMLTLAAAQRRPDLVSALVLLATPWDFHAADAAGAQAIARHLSLLEPLLAQFGALPVDALQTLFALLDPEAVARKYSGFPALPQDSVRARMFVAMEDWLNDGVPLAAAVARECLAEWYGRNTPLRRAWRIAGRPVDPADINLPCLIAIPSRDRIVPPASARALADAVHGSLVIEPGAGHIGMVAGASAEAALWRPMLEWLASH